MEAVNLDGLILIRDPGDCFADSLAISLSFRAPSCLLITPNERTLTTRFSKLFDEKRISVYRVSEGQCRSDILKEVLSMKHAFIFIDWLEVFIWEWGLDLVANFLYKLKATTCVCTIIHSSVIDETSFWRLTSVAETVLDLRRDDKATISHTSLYLRSGKIVELDESFQISTDFRISCIRLNNFSSQDEQKNDSLPSLTTSFDIGLHLKESEKKARDNLQLPYMKMQSQEGLVDIRMTCDKKIRVGGQIIYTPDDGDDFDDSDPDDDLNL